MKVISGKIEALKRFQKEADRVAIDEVANNDSIVLDMNFQEQLRDKGVNSKGVSIESYRPYSDSYLKAKKAAGKYRGYVDLNLEGDFTSSGVLKKGALQVEIDNTDYKTEWLVKRYGKSIMGLTNENLNEIRQDYVKPRLLTELRKAVSV